MTTKVSLDIIADYNGTFGVPELFSYTPTAAMFGATAGNATTGTTAINLAAAVGQPVTVEKGMAYTEGSLVLGTQCLIDHSISNRITYLFPDDGSTLPQTSGGIGIKTKGATGISLKSHDYGTAADPVLWVLNATTGNPATIHSNYLQMVETTTPTVGTDTLRLYAKHKNVSPSGTGLYVKFPTGDEVLIAYEGQESLMLASTIWDPGSIANNSSATWSVAVPNASFGDFVLASFGTDLLGLTLTGYVSSPGVVAVVLHNSTGGSKDLPSAVLTVKVVSP